MAITFASAGTGTNNTGTGNVTNAPAPATGMTANSIIAWAVGASDNVAITQGSLTQKIALTATTSFQLRVFWERGVGAARTFTHTAGDGARAQGFGFNGCVTSGDPFEVVGAGVATQFTAAGTFTINADSITTLTDGAAVLWVSVGGQKGDTSGAYTTAGYSGTTPTFTEIGDGANGLGANGFGLAVAWGTLSTHGATGAKTATLTVGGGTVTATNFVETLGVLLALKPATTTTTMPFQPRVTLQAVNRSAVF